MPGLEAVTKKTAAQGVEFEFGEEGAQSLLVARTDAELFGLEGKRNVNVNGREPLREDRLLAEFFEPFAELPLLLGGMVERIFQ